MICRTLSVGGVSSIATPVYIGGSSNSPQRLPSLRSLRRAGAIYPAPRSAEAGQFLTVVSDHSDGWQDVCPFAFLELENGLVAGGSTAPSTPASDRRVRLARPVAEGVVLRRR